MSSNKVNSFNRSERSSYVCEHVLENRLLFLLIEYIPSTMTPYHLFICCLFRRVNQILDFQYKLPCNVQDRLRVMSFGHFWNSIKDRKEIINVFAGAPCGSSNQRRVLRPVTRWRHGRRLQRRLVDQLGTAHAGTHTPRWRYTLSLLSILGAIHYICNCNINFEPNSRQIVFMRRRSKGSVWNSRERISITCFYIGDFIKTEETNK